MKHIVTIVALSLIQSIFAADEYTPLMKSPDSGFELIIIEDAIDIKKAYDQGLYANREGHLIFINQNLSSCARSQVAVHCHVKPKERQERILTRTIEKRPSMLTHFENEESSSESSDTDDEESEHNSWSNYANEPDNA